MLVCVLNETIEDLERKEPRTSHLHQVREDNHVLELAGKPNKVERVLVDGNLVGESGGIVTAQPAAAVGGNADAEVSDAGGETSVADNVLDSAVYVIVDLRCVGTCLVRLVVDGEEEDIGDKRG